ncbi:Response regulator of zinc sigma-54-dependent two-component system [Methylophaga frappieri]|uniref:Response regulator of zinc sigma-54-dependent two-component system n=1 Tax=Methylophaga frappieri (strain ATCC BAA-2434 / DSM 25690 / JAM7) TaxID=754477 RepID=I1YJ55_METFJ|nr:sigma-54 dependent transcriptional regulator [Methylophaga frappieri]AFJ02948.1 Response regulator of zinc sigma-54-dependent two-component system [Methylophaga frappieri]
MTSLPALIGHTPEMMHIQRLLPMIATSDASVLISGETGTGKELVARTLHQLSRRRETTMVVLNCAALPTQDVEVDLFGRANTSGQILETGRLLAADNGTVFLDEVDALPLALQAKVLRFLEAGECQLPGSHKLHIINARVIAATSADLPDLVKNGQFRADLYYRLQVVPIELLPLRERRDDISLLVQAFCRQFAGNNSPVRFEKSVLQQLQHYAFPGNVRELANLCQRLSLIQPGSVIKLVDLPSEMQDISPETPTFTLPDSGIDLAALELDMIEQALAKAAGNRSKAARLLGISRDTLLYRMQKYGLTE